MKSRDFIQEIIDDLKTRSIKIEKLYNEFKIGNITKEEFEENYQVHLYNIKEDVENEYESPNNGCKYLF
jgi:hypothetical protein